MKQYTNYYNRIDEGFWSWLGSLIKSLFTDDTSDDTKEYVEKTLKFSKDNFTDKQFKQMQKALQENNVDKFQKLIDEYIHSKEFDADESKSEEWEMCVLSMKIRLLADEKNTDAVKELTERFHKLSEKNPRLGKKLAAEIKKEDVPNNTQTTSSEEESTQTTNNNEQNTGNAEQSETADNKFEDQFGEYSNILNELPGIFDNKSGKHVLNENFENKFNKIIGTDNNFSEKEKFGIALLYSGIIQFDKPTELVNSVLKKYSENK